MKHYFEGAYFKHQKGEDTLCLIAGRSDSEQFLQIITEEFSANVPMPEDSSFSRNGIQLNLDDGKTSLKGSIQYRNLSPIRYDIMGPFRFFPMECRHGVISMHHRLEGSVCLNGTDIDFTGGMGYMECDSGTSFPKSYQWIQANSFSEPCAVMASVADIPFCGLTFKGCICVVQYGGREYRLATYLGVKILSSTKDELILKQGKDRLEVRVQGGTGHPLAAPQMGEMSRTILEVASCPANFRFYHRGQLLFDLDTAGASYEFAEAAL